MSLVWSALATNGFTAFSHTLQGLESAAILVASATGAAAGLGWEAQLRYLAARAFRVVEFCQPRPIHPIPLSHYKSRASSDLLWTPKLAANCPSSTHTLALGVAYPSKLLETTERTESGGPVKMAAVSRRRNAPAPLTGPARANVMSGSSP